MQDRAKVIDGLRKAAEELARYAPMKVNGRCQMYFDGAIHLLKEQESVSPNIKTNVNGIYYACGNCGEMMFGYKYCPTCGRKVKWDDSDRNGNV